MSSQGLTIGQADLRYLKLTGGTVIGLASFSAGLLTPFIFYNGNTFTVPSATGTLALVSQIPTNLVYVDLTTNQSIAGTKTFLSPIVLDNSGAKCTLTYPNVGTVTQNFPGTTGYLLNSIGNYTSVKSQGLTLSDNQTITTSTYLAGATMNFANSIYTDSATPNGATQTQFADVGLGVRTINCSNTGVTYTNAATLQIKGPVTAGTNLTITNNNAVQIDSGNITLINGRVISSSNGAVATPAFSVGGNNTGIYAGATNQLNFAVNGSNKFTMTAGSNSSTQQFRAFAGSLATPGISFTGDNTSGWYDAAVGNIALAISGVQLISYTAAKLAVLIAGSAATPSLGFQDTTTGWYRSAANQIGLSISGVNVSTWSSTGLNISGKMTTSTAQIGANGTTVSNSMQFGSFTTSVVLLTLGNAALGTFNITGFGAIPNIALTLQTPAGGLNNWDRVIVCVDGQNSTNTAITVNGVNLSTGSTSGTATIYWRVMA